MLLVWFLRFQWLLTPGGLARALTLKPSPTVLAVRNGLSGLSLLHRYLGFKANSAAMTIELTQDFWLSRQLRDVRSHSLPQSVEIVATLKARNDAPVACLLRPFFDRARQ